MILITGSTGKVGQHVISALQAQGAPFKALARSEASAQSLAAQGVTVVRGDLTDAASFRAALAGVDTLFLLSASAEPFAQEAPALEVAKAAGVKKIVKLSAFGAQADSVNPFLRGHARVERLIEASGLSFVFLRPSFFMQNWVLYNAPAIKAGQPVYANAGDGRMGWIDTRDIAAVAAVALTSPAQDGRVLELTGPEPLGYAQVTTKLSGLLGRDVAYVPVPDAAAYGAIQGMGMSPDYAWALVTLNQTVRRGHSDAATQTVELVTGSPARTMDAFLAEHLDAFRVEPT
jgi:uncharacterized protein YbjT (DUF2867 family)